MGQRASKRERRKPELFGSFGAAEQAEELEPEQRLADSEAEEEEEKRPRKRARRQRRRAADSDEDEEEQGEPAAAVARGGSRGRGGAKRAARQPRKQQQREAAGLPAPAAPLSRADFLGALHACPVLMDMILQADRLRTPTLLAFDAANLAVALSASSEQMDCAWRTLAARAAGTEGFAGTSAEDGQRCTATTAKQDYRLSDKDLGGLECELQPNPVFWRGAAPTRLYRVLDCLAIAHRKYGDLAGIQAAKAKATERGQKVKATRQGNTQRRKEEIEEAIKAAGLDWAKYQRSSEVANFIKHGKVPAAAMADGLKKAEQAAAKRAERERKLRQRLEKEGLAFHSYHAAVLRYLAGEGKETIASTVATLKKEKDDRQAAEARKEEVKQRLREEGLLGAEEYFYEYGFRGATEYINHGLGSLAGVVEAARAAGEAKAERQQQWQQQQEQKAQRDAALRQLLADAGIPTPSWQYCGAANHFVHKGKGTAQQAFQAQHEQHVAQAEKQQRHDQLSALLAAHGLQLRYCQNDPSIERHLQGKDELSEEQLLAAARMQCQQAQQHRQQQQAQWQRSARESTMAQLLARAGLHSFYAYTVPAVAAYISTGQGNEADALEAAREYHQQHAGAAGRGQGGPGAAAAAAAGEQQMNITSLTCLSRPIPPVPPPLLAAPATMRAAILALLALAVCVSAQNRAQQCIPLGGPLISQCTDELAYLNKPENYPLTSTAAPDDAKVQSVIAGLPAGLPKPACCAAVQKFDAAGCGCEASLSSTLKAVGLESAPEGLKGVTKIAATACKFTPFTC